MNDNITKAEEEALLELKAQQKVSAIKEIMQKMKKSNPKDFDAEKALKAIEEQLSDFEG